MDSIIGKCCVLWVKDYCNCRPTEIPEENVFICESKYHEMEKTLRRLSKGLKKHTLSPRVTDDEILFFRKPVIPLKEPSPLLSKQGEDGSMSYDGEESRDTFTDAIPEILNTSMEEYTVVSSAETKTPKRVDDLKAGDSSKKKGKAKDANKRTQISGYIVFSGEFRKIVQQQNPDCNFGEISRLVGGKWRNLDKEEKEKYEEKARKIAEEQQAKQEAATKAFNESLTKTQQTQQWTEQQQANTPQAQAPRPATPGNTGFPQGYYPTYSASPGQYGATAYAPSPGPGAQFTPMNPAYQGQQQMAPPPPPPRPPSPMFVTVPPRTQRLLHSEAYLKYIEGLNADSRSISDWEKSLSATQENTQVPDESRLPAHWLGQGAGYHGSVTDALWALRDLMLKDSLNIQRTLPFDAL